MNLLNRLAAEQAAKELEASLPEFEQAAIVIAKLTYIYYEGLLSAGFSEDAALSIVRDHGINAGRIMSQGGDV